LHCSRTEVDRGIDLLGCDCPEGESVDDVRRVGSRLGVTPPVCSDRRGRLVGMVTQSDLVAALYRAQSGA
jgi:CBS-domain-containing membrane protein